MPALTCPSYSALNEKRAWPGLTKRPLENGPIGSVEMEGWKRRSVLAAAAMLLSLGSLSPTTATAEKVLRVIPHADLKVLDPIWTTAYISRNHGYLIYDTLFAMDENFEPQPQMVDTWEVSDDGLEWT